MVVRLFPDSRQWVNAIIAFATRIETMMGKMKCASLLSSIKMTVSEKVSLAT